MRKCIAIGLCALVVAGCRGSEPDSLVTPSGGADPAAEAEALSADPEVEAQWRRGQESLAAGNATAALEHFGAIPRDGSELSIQAALAAAEIQESQGRLGGAIESYEYVLQHQPELYAVMGRAAELYALTGQRAEADRHLAQLVKTPELGFKHLVLLTDFERRHGDDYTRLLECEERASDDPAVQLGLAVEDLRLGQLDSAKRRLEAAVASAPELGAAQALLGEVLLLESATEQLAQWHRSLPESVQDHSAIWYTRGLWAQQLNALPVAARCFWESLRQCPTSYRATYQLGQLTGGLAPEMRESFAQRAASLHQLKEYLSRVLDSAGRDEEAARNLVQLLLDSGREWEAWSWGIMLQPKYPAAGWLRQSLSELSSYPHTESPRIVASANPAVQYDLSAYPDFTSLAARIDVSPRDALPAADGSIRFAEVARDRGIAFVYHRGRVEGLEGVRMQESTGGGVGVLDFDGDAWPDLFLTQGEDWPASSDRPAGTPGYRDALMRNGVTRFEDRTTAALPEEDGFGQGCACGDFNSDGFPDIYVANIGANQLLLNCGDGTFIDGTPQEVLALDAWTTSCGMADLTGDGHPDLFDVNYVAGPQLYQMICDENECSPEAYAEAADFALISQGDGGTKVVAPNTDGREGGGLGLVVFRADRAEDPRAAVDAGPAGAAGDHVVGSSSALTPENRLSLFVANDQDPNHFLTVGAGDDRGSASLTDEAFQTGLALNMNGNTSACMGIAAGDMTGDGRLDLYVTNYNDEADLFFTQAGDGLFSDWIAGCGLLHAGLRYVGWGAQCLDADNDGDLDLVAANGHVGYFKEPRIAERMPTQVFANAGGGRFHELPPEDVGAFFTRPVMGRSLATCDWNRDGRPDCVLSLLDENAALLENQSEVAGNWLTLRLIGSQSARDPIGAVVTVQTSRRTIRGQLTGGDGYQASNERVLRFGLGQDAVADSIHIDWPSGQSQDYVGVPANRILIARENRPYLDLSFHP